MKLPPPLRRRGGLHSPCIPARHPLNWRAMTPYRFVTLILTAALCALPAPAAELPASRPAKPVEVPNFSLIDYRGNAFELRRADAKVVVLFFTGIGCPIARQNAP